MNNRNISLDFIRIVAIAAVIMIHVSAGFVTNYESDSLEFVCGNIFDSISRIGVPLFVMVSGALMLDEKRPFSIKNLFSKRLPQLILLLITWSAIYAVIYVIIIPLLKGNNISITSLVEKFALGHYHLWYLYMQIGLYLALPFLRTIVCKKNKNLVLIYIAISLLSQFTIPMIQALSLRFDVVSNLITFIKQFHLGFFNAYVSYFLAGWYIVHVGVSRNNKFMLSFAATLALLVMIIYVNYTKDYKNAYSNPGILVFVYSIGVFNALNNINIKSIYQNVFSVISKLSFGIYVIHIIFLTVIDKFLPPILAPMHILLCWTLTFTVSLLVTFIFSKIPYLKKLVRT